MINMEENEIVRVENLSVSHEDDMPVLKNISFTVQKGERLLLLGPSGSGKSTLTFCLNGLLPTSMEGQRSGTIRLFGKKIEEFELGEASRYIGVVFQDPDSQFCMLTVEDEVAFGLENLKFTRKEILEQIDLALSLVGLEQYKKATIASLSGGLKQKLALACIIAMKPNLLILDEPTALLDPITTREFAQTIDALQAELGFALVVIEHKLDHWVTFMDRCLILTQLGELMYDGSFKEGMQNHYVELNRLGICLPKVTQLSQQLKEQGELRQSLVPLTEDELIESIDPTNLPYPIDVVSVLFPKPVIEMKNVAFSRGNISILKNINLSIRKGECTAIVGPNGAGKSTLSFLLAGLLKQDSGEILYETQIMNKLIEAEKRKLIGYVFQNPEHQFITDSVFDEVAFGMRMQGIKEEIINSSVKNILISCRLTEQMNQNPFALSQGQKRRLSVATMLVEEQALLILDEPTFGQDARASAELMNMIQARLNSGVSALMITHDMELVAAYAHRVIVLVDGGVSFQGTPFDLFTNQTDLLDKAHLEAPLLYSLLGKWRKRSEQIATTNIKS